MPIYIKEDFIMSEHFCVAVVGGAVAGSEAVDKMVKSGIKVVVFEQNSLPYGKIESGLPKWHIKLRNKQEDKINIRLDNPDVHLIPNCILGKDVQFEDVLKNWGFNAILLAVGAWKDRALPVAGIESFLGNGFYYQNPFVQWFNLCHDPNYSGPQFTIEDGAIIIGGGLASIDVAKILMIESFKKAINKLGKELDSNTIEQLGLPKAAEHIGIRLKDLNLKGCSIIYRRRIVDMPLSPNPKSNSEADIQKVQKVRKKIIGLAQEKFLFKVVDCFSPKSIIVENDKLCGLIIHKNKIEDGNVIPLPDDTESIKAPLVISSIGSIPDKIRGINQVGEKFDIEDPDTGKIKGFDRVFALGNAVTGKGNIQESQKHSRSVSELIVKNYLGIQDKDSDFEMPIKTGIDKQVAPIVSFIKESEALSDHEYKGILTKVNDLQMKAGYDGNYKKWISKHLPTRLENMK